MGPNRIELVPTAPGVYSAHLRTEHCDAPHTVDAPVIDIDAPLHAELDRVRLYWATRLHNPAIKGWPVYCHQPKPVEAEQ